MKRKGTALKSFWPVAKVPMAFCHVVGEEEITAIKTALSNEQSKANVKEVEKVVSIVTAEREINSKLSTKGVSWGIMEWLLIQTQSGKLIIFRQ